MSTHELEMWAVDGKRYAKRLPRDVDEAEVVDRFWKQPTIVCDQPKGWMLVTRHVVAFRVSLAE